MDVEKRTLISAGMDATGITSGMASVTTDAAKMAAGVTQSVGQISRALLDSGRGFDSLARNFADGFKNAQAFAQAIQTAYRSVGDGRDKLNLIPQILDNISAKYGIFGQAARQAALKMVDATATQAQRLQAFQSLIASAGGQAAPTSSAVPSVAPNVAIVEAYNTALSNLQAKYSPLAAAAQTYQTALAGIASAEMVGVDAANARSAASVPYLRAQAAEAAGMDTLRASFDPLYRVSKQYEQELEFVRLASAKLGQTQAQTEANQAGVTASFAAVNAPLQQHGKTLDSVTGSTWGQSFAMRQLGVQSIQTISSIASGLPIWMTLIQQGHQVVDVSVSAGVGFKALAEGAMSYVAALLRIPAVMAGLTVAAIVAPFLVLGIALETVSRRLIDLQQHLRATRTDYESLGQTVLDASRAASQSTTLSSADARTAGQVLAAQPNFAGTQQQLTDLIALAGDVARVFNIDIKAAAHQLAVALQDPAKAAKDLAEKHFPGMTVAIARDVEMLELQGRTIDAQNIVLGNYQRQIKAAADAGTPLQHALTAMGNNLDALLTHIGTFVNGILSAGSTIGTWIRDHPPLGFDITGRAREEVPMRGPGAPVLMNPESGAAGIMQIMPGTARATPNLNPMEPLGNIELGVIDFQRKLTAAAGDINTALKNYGGFVNKDPTAYIASVQAQDVSKLTPGIADAIERIAREKGIVDQNLIATLQKIAVHESGGNQFATTAAQVASLQRGLALWGAQGQAAATVMPPGVFGPPAPTAAQAGASNMLQGRMNAADTDFNTKAIEAQRKVIESTIIGYTNLVGVVGENTEAGQKYQTLIGILSGTLTNQRTPLEQNIKGLRDQAGVSGFEAGAAKALADAYHALDEASIQYTGHTATAAEKDVARALVMERLSKETQVSVDVQNRQTEATRGVIGVLGQGQKAQDDYTATIKAQEEAFKTVGTREGPEYARMLAMLTAANIATADSERAKTNAAALYSDTTEGQRIAIRANIMELQRQRDASGTTTEQAKLFNERISIQSGLLMNLRTPLEEVNKGLKDNTDLARAGDGAARQYAEALHTATEAARQRGQASLTDAERLKVIGEVTARLNAEASTSVATIDRQTATLETQNQTLAGMITRYGSFAAVLEHLDNARKASEQVHATANANSADEKEQIDAVTAALDRQSAALRARALIPQLVQGQQQVSELRRQGAAIGSGVSFEDQARTTAELAESMRLGADRATEFGQALIRLKGDEAAVTVQNQVLKSNYDELANATSQSFDTIGNAIAQAFVSGEGAAVSFQNVLKAVIAQVIQEMIKLSVINPILNSLFPGTQERPTAGGVLGAMFGGATALVGGGGIESGTWDVGFAKGGVFSGSPSLSAFSNSIVSTPTLFDTGLSGFRAYAQGGTGLMGEAGSEAIVPLVRGPDGNLGVRGGGGGGGVSVVVNTPITINGGGGGQQQGKPLDPQALKALQQQIDQTVRHAVRTTIVDERRPGGDLFFR